MMPTLWKIVWQFLKRLNIDLCTQQFYSLESTQEEGKYMSTKVLCTNVHNIIFHHCQIVETTQMSINW